MKIRYDSKRKVVVILVEKGERAVFDNLQECKDGEVAIRVVRSSKVELELPVVEE